VEPYKREWGRNVERGRKILGLSQRRLAEICEVTQQTISSIERGEYAPRDGLKLKLAAALHQDVRQLFPLVQVA
jgi:putative transcriptional regulator